MNMSLEVRSAKHKDLLKLIRSAVNYASDLSNNEHDQYARCVDELLKSLAAIHEPLHEQQGE